MRVTSAGATHAPLGGGEEFARGDAVTLHYCTTEWTLIYGALPDRLYGERDNDRCWADRQKTGFSRRRQRPLGGVLATR